jgi:WhiB family transcriptional regulator, redox-sensing transcriptional regulator
VRFAKVLCDPEKDPELWFPDATLGPYGRRIAVQKAKAICKGCPVRAACLQIALDADIQYRIWRANRPRTPSAESKARAIVSR